MRKSFGVGNDEEDVCPNIMEEARTMLRWQTIALFLYCIPPAIPKSLLDIAPAFFLTRSKNMLERISENASSDEEF